MVRADMIPWAIDQYERICGDPDIPQHLLVHYDQNPELLLNFTNGSYHGMSATRVGNIYKRVYGFRLQWYHWELWDDGTFYSRLDRFPYWIRDMLAYRAAARRKARYFELLNTVKYWIQVYLARIQDWWYNKLDYWFLRDFPPNMRHLWRQSHHVQWPGRERYWAQNMRIPY